MPLQSLVLSQSLSDNKPIKERGHHVEALRIKVLQVNDAAPYYVDSSRKNMGHIFRILGLTQETFVRNLEPIPGLDKSC